MKGVGSGLRMTRGRNGKSDRLKGLLHTCRLRKFTEHTVVDVEALAEHLDKVARQGYALEDEEAEVGVRGVAAPILDASQEVVAAVGLVGPAYRFSLARIEGEFVPLVRQAGIAFSRRLGLRTAATSTG